MTIMNPKYAESKCFKDGKRCKYLVARQLTDVEGRPFYVYYCKCEDIMCAGCIPTFVKGLNKITYRGI